MLELTIHVPMPTTPCTTTMTLPYAQRQKSRFRGRLDDGSEVAILLPRGTVLRNGDVLTTDDRDSLRVQVLAAPEALSVVHDEDPLALLRAAYHLGNRHIPLQIERDSLRFAADHVLDDMLHGLGIHVRHQSLPFEPESGAYGGGHGHHHDHD